MNKRLTLITSLCLWLTAGVAQLTDNQIQKIDSLEKVIKTAKHDTIKVNALATWDKIIYVSESQLDLELNKQIKDICEYNLTKQLTEKETQKFKNSIATSLNNIGVIYKDQGDYAKAIGYHTRSLKIEEELGNKNGIARSLNNIGNIYKDQGDYAKAIDYFTRSLKIFEELGDKRLIAKPLNNIGVIHKVQGDYPKAIDNYTRSLKIEEELGNKNGIARSLNNIGNIYKDQGDYAKAIGYHTRSLKIREEIGDKKGIASSWNNIGIIYYCQGDYPKAIEYYTKSLKIKEELGDKKRIANSLGNIGLIYKDQGDYAKAIDYQSRSLKIHEELGDKKGIASSLNNIGIIYYGQGDYTKAIDYFTRSLKIKEEIGDKSGIATSLNNIGSIYAEQGNYLKALEKLSKSLSIAQEIGDIGRIRSASNNLWEPYKKLGKHSQALEMHELYIEMRDSMLSIENKEAIIQQEFKYKYEKEQALADAKHQEELALSAEREKRQELIAWSAGGGLVMVLAFAFFIFNRLQVTRRQKTIIEQQKELVEEQKKDITDSIQYAENIQKALLPSAHELSLIPDGFVLFHPKDIVSGDFYWMQHHNDVVYLAACDCTGHGVPGAFMSMIGSSLLDEAVVEKGITQPNEIFYEVRQGFINALKQTGEAGQQKDGMDATLIAWDKKSTLQLAAAYSPVFIISNGEMKELKPDRQPVGFHTGVQKPFTHHEMKLEKGDTVYIFSDGYPDQFGGPKDKKFMMKNFKKLLLSIQDKTMNEQKTILETTMADWKGDTEQVDDILVMGVRF